MLYEAGIGGVRDGLPGGSVDWPAAIETHLSGHVEALARWWSNGLVCRSCFLFRGSEVDVGIEVDAGVLEEDVPGEQFVEIDGCQIDGLEEADLPDTPLPSDKVGNGLKLGGGPATQDGFTGDGVKVTKC